VNAIESWPKIKLFEPHMEFISRAVDRYRNTDYLSCISVLFPRIEGILRGFRSVQGQANRTSQKDLAATVLSCDVNAKNHEYSPLLPLRFSRYLEEVYFAHFNPECSTNPLSRNSIGHGVATEDAFNLKGATLGFLLLDQLSYYFS